MKRLYITLRNEEGYEIFSDFIQNIDAVNSHTCIYPRSTHSESRVIRIFYDLLSFYIKDGIVLLYYQGGLFAEVTRR